MRRSACEFRCPRCFAKSSRLVHNPVAYTPSPPIKTSSFLRILLQDNVHQLADFRCDALACLIRCALVTSTLKYYVRSLQFFRIGKTYQRAVPSSFACIYACLNNNHNLRIIRIFTKCILIFSIYSWLSPLKFAITAFCFAPNMPVCPAIRRYNKYSATYQMSGIPISTLAKATFVPNWPHFYLCKGKVRLIFRIFHLATNVGLILSPIRGSVAAPFVADKVRYFVVGDNYVAA